VRTGARQLKIDELEISIYETNETLGIAAAEDAATTINLATASRGSANIVLATGNSQRTFLEALRSRHDIDWSKVEIFHLDEYVGIDPSHSASFPNFLRKHFVDHVRPRAFHPLRGSEEDLGRICREYEAMLRARPVDLCALGIGENGHLAFNDPPYADFADPVWVKVVKLAPKSRQQQVDERHFAGIEEVPTEAITMTIPAIFAASRLLVMVPETRKAEAVWRTLYGPITEDCPSSLLRRSTKVRLFLDGESAAGAVANSRLTSLEAGR